MRRRYGVWPIALPLLLVVGWLLGGQEFGAPSSALSRDERGWLAARRYLEERGARVELRDTPLSTERDTPENGTPTDGTAEDEAGVLVLAFPWQTRSALESRELEALGDHLRGGGTVLLAYSGNRPGAQESRIFKALTLEASPVRSSPPLIPTRWWRYHRQSWLLQPADRDPAALEAGLALSALQEAPEAPAGARILYRGADDDRPLVFDYPLHRGRVVVVPAEIFANVRLGEAGNLAFLNALLEGLGPAWSFDEFHHGLVAVSSAPSASRFAWDLLLIHFGLIYLLGLVALGRRFGPVWQEVPTSSGSTASFLRQLGALHHRLGHHQPAAELLIERARDFDPDLPIPPSTDEGLTRTVRDAPRLLKLARRVSRAQRRALPGLPNPDSSGSTP